MVCVLCALDGLSAAVALAIPKVESMVSVIVAHISHAINFPCAARLDHAGSIVLKIDGTKWSAREIDLEANVDGCAYHVTECSGGVQYPLLYTSQFGSGLLADTRLLIVAPLYVIVNNTSYDLCFRQSGVEQEVLVESEGRSPWLWTAGESTAEVRRI